MKTAWVVLFASFAIGCAGTKPETAAAPAGPAVSAAPGASPRHQEWAEVGHDERIVRCFVVYPESAERRPAVVVLHENKGLTDWVRSVADRLAAEGYVAIAPDLLSGTGAGGGGTETYATEDAATKGIYALPPQQVTADLQAVTDYVKELPGCDGTASVGGFCWGGSQSFRFATDRPDLTAAFVFYGTGPEDAAAIARIQCPVRGFYAGNDARVNATLGKSEQMMRAAGKTFDPVTYPGAGHGFMRAGGEPNADPANRTARDQAWARWLDLLKKR